MIKGFTLTRVKEFALCGRCIRMATRKIAQEAFYAISCRDSHEDETK